MKITLTQKLTKENQGNKKLSKHVTAFDYKDRVLLLLSAKSSGVSIISFKSVVRAPVVIASASITLIFSLKTGIIKQLMSIRRKKKKKHDKILMLAKHSSTDWHGNKTWKIYHDFERKK